MSRFGDEDAEFEMQSRVDQSEVANSTAENPTLRNDGNSEHGDSPTPTETETPRKANEFRGRQIQMMAISMCPTTIEG